MRGAEELGETGGTGDPEERSGGWTSASTSPSLGGGGKTQKPGEPHPCLSLSTSPKP